MPLLEVKNLVKKFPLRGGLFGQVKGYVHAVNGVSLSIEEGQTLGLVGESGSGKTTLGRTILRLHSADAGQILFEGKDLTRLSERRFRPLRKKMQIIFQDPYSSLNPRMNVETLLSEGMLIHHVGNKNERRKRVLEMLEVVGLPPEALSKYPHEFSGGQRQRIGIARALCLLPSLIVCDEPVSALDVSIQGQIINLLADLKREFKLTYLFISHDLKVVSHLSDKIAVMYLGEIMEYLPADQLFQARHPYTHALLAAIPRPVPRKLRREVLQGEIPSSIQLPSGCVFHTRCPYAKEVCKKEVPLLREVSNHQVACHLAEEIPLFNEKG
jgi:oligopeptide/dipeptide ABC transporter ATP-binding protein